ncbi:MAG: hypothetical protein K5650_05090, partial [Bacteroidales bacterium]|nr:hypothetical protein [Bacteroidales bacterium]
NSGIKIIEITLPKGTDNLNDLTLLSETDDYEYERKKSKQISIGFYNFKRNYVSKDPFEIYSIPVFFINNNGRGQVAMHNRCCNFYGLGHLEDETSFEIHFSNECHAYKAGVAIANLKGFNVRNCWVCKYHWYSNKYSTHNCNRSISIKRPSDAQQCESYLFDRYKALSLEKETNNEYQIIWPIQLD